MPINPGESFSDIPGNQVQLNIKERNLSPFFKSLLDQRMPLPKSVSFRCYDAPQMAEVVVAIGLACVVCVIPSLIVIIGSVILRNYSVAAFILAGLLLFAFGCTLYWARKKYKDVQDYKAGNYRYGRFLCRYALLVRHKGSCQIFPKHKLLDAQFQKSRTRRGAQWWHLYFYYLDDKGRKVSYQIASGTGGHPIDKPLQTWIQQPLAIKPLVKALEDEEPDVRFKAATILKENEWMPENPRQRTVYLLAQKDWEALRAMESTLSSDILVNALGDHDPVIRTEATKILEHIGWKPGDDKENIYYFSARKRWATFLVLGAPTSPEPLMTVLGKNKTFLREDLTAALKSLYASIKSVMFGTPYISSQPQRFTLHNPDVYDLTFSMSNLKRILIATEAYDFYVVERFLTYAIDYIGQKYLKKQVEVHLYGDPDKLQRNLRNTLTNLCNSVHVHEAADLSDVEVGSSATDEDV